MNRENIFKRALKRSREGWFGKAVHLFDRAAVDGAVWEELEEMLIAADVGVTTTDKLIERVKDRVSRDRLTDGVAVREVLKEEMAAILNVPEPVTSDASTPKVTMVVGVNGSGKTTSIAKLAYRRVRNGSSVLLAAADTFRAAAIDQLKVQGERAGVAVIAHQPGADPGAVAYDAVQAARNRCVDNVIIDTAGRLHTKYNLMEELKKVRRVVNKLDSGAPHEVILVIDATTGQNGLMQARSFTRAVGVNSIILAKLDGTAKGGIVLAICDELKIPIDYVGIGEGLEDLVPFDARQFVEAIYV